MWLLLLSLSSVFFDLCVSQSREDVCYGGSFNLPFQYSPPMYRGPVYFRPHRGGPSRIVMDDGKSQDPRLVVSYGRVSFEDVREDGYFSTSRSGSKLTKIIDIKVLDCAEKFRRKYGNSFQYKVPPMADFLEFMPGYDRKQSSILWNRTNHEMDANSRGQVKNNHWQIPHLTQKDNGYYYFRMNRGLFLARISLSVQEHTATLTLDEYDHLEIVHPWLADMKTVTFTPEGEDKPTTTMRDGRLENNHWSNTHIQAVTNGIELLHVESENTGTFHFRDSDDNLIMIVHLKVMDDSIIGNVQIASFALLFPTMIVVFCCCCFIKRHYKKYHCAPETPIPATGNHHGGNQAASPAAPSSSTFSYRPVAKAPTVPSSNPPVYQPVKVHMAPTPTQPTQVGQPVNVPTPPQVAPSGRQDSTLVPPISSGFLSSNCEPTFKLKGVASASPLSSDSTVCDVYTSDKLNFL